MTKKDEKRFYDHVKPFIDNELSFIITEDDRNKYSCGGESRARRIFDIRKQTYGDDCDNEETNDQCRKEIGLVSHFCRLKVGESGDTVGESETAVILAEDCNSADNCANACGFESR